MERDSYHLDANGVDLEMEEAAANAAAVANLEVENLEMSWLQLHNHTAQFFEDTLANLQRRFPDMDPEIIAKVLTEQQGHGGRTVKELREIFEKSRADGPPPPPLARLSSPGAATPGAATDSDGFPNALGPFALVETSFSQADLWINSASRFSGGSGKVSAAERSWSMRTSTSLRGAARAALPPSLSGVARIAGRLSAEHPVTLPEADKRTAGIPDEAVSFAWSYPIEQELPISEESASSPDVTFLAVGGYIYFDASQPMPRIIKVTALVPSPSGGLRFDSPKTWLPEWTSKVGRHAFRPVTIPEMREAGARSFAWIRPGEVEGIKHGGFAYLFQHPHEKSPQRDLYFPVLGGEEETMADAFVDQPLRSLPASKEHVGVPLAPWDLRASVSITPAMEITSSTECEETHVLVSVQPPTGAACQPTSVCIVLDVSGSMRKEATLQGTGPNECQGLSLLDVAKHGVRTIIHTLGIHDHLSLVSFNNKATVIFPPTQMNDAGRQMAEDRVEKLEAKGGTNIWAGLNAGLSALQTTEEEGEFGHIMLLTDGVSAKAESVMANLREHKRTQGLPCTINTFGFGYKLDSTMLVNIAGEGTGSYSFIPDAGFVGTVFINTISNLLVTMARDVCLDLTAGPGAEILQSNFHAYEPVQQHGGECIRICLGTLQFGQTRDVIVPMKIFRPADHILRVSCRYEISRHPKEPQGVELVDLLVGCSAPTPEQICRIEQHRCRTLLIDQIPECMNKAAGASTEADLAEALSLMQSFASNIVRSRDERIRTRKIEDNKEIEDMDSDSDSIAAALDESTQALLQDVQGQVSEALSRMDWYAKWGVHYLPSLMFAHLHQQCNNFKDPGVQCYGGPLFEMVRDEADETFNKLPPPKPSVHPPPDLSASTASLLAAATSASAPRPTPVFTMAAYNDSCGG